MATKTKPAAKKRVGAKPAKKYELKTKPTAVSVAAFIDGIEKETRRSDAKALLALMKKVTGETPKMWGPSIVGFGQYHYKYDSGHEGDMCVAGFSPRSKALVVYLDPELLSNEALMAKLGRHRHGKSCLYLNRLADVDLGVLESLIAQSLVRARAMDTRPRGIKAGR